MCSYLVHQRPNLFFCRTAKVWKNFTLVYDLKEHEQSVWAVLAIDEDRFLTGEYIVPLVFFLHVDRVVISRIRRQNDQALAAPQSNANIPRPSRCCTWFGPNARYWLCILFQRQASAAPRNLDDDSPMRTQ